MSSTTASADAGDSSGTETAGLVLQVKGLRKSYETDRDIPVRALRGLDLTVSRGESSRCAGRPGAASRRSSVPSPDWSRWPPAGWRTTARTSPGCRPTAEASR